MKLKELALCLLALPLVWACSSNDEFEEPIPEPTPTPKYYPLTIEVNENPLVDSTATSANTGRFKAPITYLNTLTGFNLSYIYATGEDADDGGQPYRYGTEWVSDNDGRGHWQVGNEGQYGWPGGAVSTTGGGNGDIEVTWYAYTEGASIQMDNYSKNPYLNYTVEEASTNQKDLLVSKNTYTWNNSHGVMFFTFNHACSALKFYIKKATNVKDHAIVVSEVKLHQVKKSGRYYLEDDSWTLLDGTSDYTLFLETNENQAITLESDKDKYAALYAGTLQQDTENAYLFLLPQTLTAWNPLESLSATSGSYLELRFKLDGVEKTGYVPFAGTFNKGEKHNVWINIGKNSLYNANGSKIIN